DRIELAADLARSVRLAVEGVLVGQPAGQVDDDDRLVRPPANLGAQQCRQRQTAESPAADLEERPAGETVAEPAAGADEREHGSLPGPVGREGSPAGG